MGKNQPIDNNKNWFFYHTGTLNGHLTLSQNGTLRDTVYVSSDQPLQQLIAIDQADMDLLNKNATYIETYWFIDCEYVNKTDGLTAQNHFKTENSTHDLEVLVVASFDPRPQVW